MRPVDKGNAPRTYTTYKDARHDLAGLVGYYCSYCEMKVRNSIEVEHILPINQGGDLVDWNNFLLSCKYCNTIKNDHNDNLTDYLWPDRDNTDLAFFYSEGMGVTPKTHYNTNIQQLTNNSINLMGLDRYPGGSKEPTIADTRWRSRQEAWDLARYSYRNWKAVPIPAMAQQIAIAALCGGHYSIWIEVFKEEPEVMVAIDSIYRDRCGLYKEIDDQGHRVIRSGGQL
jgi:hypothetical protein